MTASITTADAARALLERLFRSFLDPARSPKDLLEFISPDCVHQVDGKTLVLDDFLKHAAAVKAAIVGADVTFERLVFDPVQATVADVHVVNALKTDGTRIRSKVIAFYRLESGKIREVDELTLMLKGSLEDRDLGSRT